jgi:hypothetical protein
MPAALQHFAFVSGAANRNAWGLINRKLFRPATPNADGPARPWCSHAGRKLYVISGGPRPGASTSAVNEILEPYKPALGSPLLLRYGRLTCLSSQSAITFDMSRLFFSSIIM